MYKPSIYYASHGICTARLLRASNSHIYSLAQLSAESRRVKNAYGLLKVITCKRVRKPWCGYDDLIDVIYLELQHIQRELQTFNVLWWVYGQIHRVYPIQRNDEIGLNNYRLKWCQRVTADHRGYHCCHFPSQIYYSERKPSSSDANLIGRLFRQIAVFN